MQYSDGNPHIRGGVENMAYEKSQFSTDVSLYIEMIQDTAMVRPTMECEIENRTHSTIFNDLEPSLTEISRLRHYLTLNISETV